MTPEYGPHLWEVCFRCNYNTHRCPCCGTDLTHVEAERGRHCDLPASWTTTTAEGYGR